MWINATDIFITIGVSFMGGMITAFMLMLRVMVNRPAK